MILTWLGHSCFKIQDKNGVDNITIVTDPFDKKIGLRAPNVEADIVTVSHSHYDHNNTKSLRGKPFIVNTAGEYDVKGISIYGVESYHDTQKGEKRGINIIFRIKIGGITITHLGDLGHILDNKQLEILTGTDILLIPVGGTYTLDAEKAVKVINQIEPRIIIPMHYKTKGLNLDIASVDNFIKVIGLKPTEEEKLKINPKDLPQEDMELVIMKGV